MPNAKAVAGGINPLKPTLSTDSGADAKDHNTRHRLPCFHVLRGCDRASHFVHDWPQINAFPAPNTAPEPITAHPQMVASDRSRDTLPIPLSLGAIKNGRFLPQDHQCGSRRTQRPTQNTAAAIGGQSITPRHRSYLLLLSLLAWWRVSVHASLSTASCRRGLGQLRNSRKVVIQATCTKWPVSHKTTSHQRAEDGANDAVPQRSLEVELPQRHIFVVSPVHLRKK